VRLNYTLEDKLRRLEIQLERLKDESSHHQLAPKIHSDRANEKSGKQKEQSESKDHRQENPELEELKSELADLQIKTKRQEHIIRALRMQLKNLNIEKIKQTDTEVLEKKVQHEFDVSQGVDIEDYQKDLVEENDFVEALDEIIGEPETLFPESMSFKEQKLRKTGNEVLDFTKVHQRVAQMKSVRDESFEEDMTRISQINWTETLGKPADRPSNLSLIFNMRNNTSKSLKALGINSFEQLSRLKPDHHHALEAALRLPQGTIAAEKWVQQAGNLCSEENINSIFLQTRSQNYQNDQPEEDLDLTLIRGIGRTYKKRLEASGITSIHDLAHWQDDNMEELAALISVPLEKIERERWLHQARLLVKKNSQSEE
jgi:predicted flap endonuclease-1-like 5' DNA nuclease